DEGSAPDGGLRSLAAAHRRREPRARPRAPPEPQRRGPARTARPRPGRPRCRRDRRPNQETRMIELYSIRDVSRILAVQEARLRYWMQTGFVRPTVRKGGPTASRQVVAACAAEDRGESDIAEHLFRQAIDLERNVAAALTNLGNLVYRQGELHEARSLYERALEHEPAQPEARYNLANL